jgi:CheY-like chemotaxis protein
MDVSRISREKMALRQEIHDLREAVMHAVEGCQPSIQAKDQQLRVELPEAPLPVMADRVRMEQVITNLLVNATRYTEAGGCIWLTVRNEDDTAVVRVRDTGVGISPELLPRVFDLFVQADTSLDRPQGGLGIGLTLVKNLIELHEGVVEAFSAGLGAGSEFVVRLPLKADVTPVTAPRRESPVHPSLERRVVLVEDNRDAREVLAELLTMLGHQVFAAADGPSALRVAQEERPGVFLVDIGLPGMDGYQVARALRQRPGSDQLLLIALTGDAHLTKPADLAELERLLAVAR